MYAIVRAGGRQEKVAVGDVLVVDRLTGAPGDETRFTPVLLVDGATVTSDADALSKLVVAGKIVEDLKGPKINILKYKNKTGYKKRQGHRSHLTRVEITKIGK
ncbi:50S ribosomal protein L21 [Jannaschia sp. R86511]|uniref:50S ribosomal protein L21 n=1 Tax=Jannaschia sp. R86511 TaxID=3093853 RepID=UPI0036D38F4C